MDRNAPQTKAWVEAWIQAGRKLEAIRRRRLREFVHADHVQEIDDLLDIACRFAQPRRTSGLVEQQRLFAQLRHERDL